MKYLGRLTGRINWAWVWPHYLHQASTHNGLAENHFLQLNLAVPQVGLDILRERQDEMRIHRENVEAVLRQAIRIEMGGHVPTVIALLSPSSSSEEDDW